MITIIIGLLLSLSNSNYLEYIQGFQSDTALSMVGISDVAIAPDNQYLYMLNNGDKSIKTFKYDKNSGIIELIQTLEDSDADNNFNFPEDIKVSPNGQWLYTYNQVDYTLLKFDRQPDGTLVYDSTANTSLPSGSVGQQFIISANSEDLYAGTRFGDSFYHYKINQVNGHLSLQNTYTNNTNSGGNTITTMNGVDSLWLSEDQAFLYLTTFSGDSVLMFTRAANGDLTYTQKIENNTGGITGFENTDNISGFTSGNNSFVIIQADSSNRTFSFSRNVNTGLLTYLGFNSLSSFRVVSSSSSQKFYFCSNASSVTSYEVSMSSPNPLVLADNVFTDDSSGCGGLYITSDDAFIGRIANFITFNTDKFITYSIDQQSNLNYLRTYPSDSIDNMEDVSSINSAPNSPHVYVTGLSSNSIQTFVRENDGQLTHMEGFSYIDDNGPSGYEGLSLIIDLIISDDGEHIYTVGQGDNAIGHYTRNTNDQSALYGLLTFQQMYQNGVNSITGLAGIYSLKFSNDQNQDYIYATSLTDDAITVFQRNLDGSLNQIQTITDATHPGTLNTVAEIHINADGSRAYAVSLSGNAIFEYTINNGQLTFVKDIDNVPLGSPGGFSTPVSMALISENPSFPTDSMFVYSIDGGGIEYVQRDEMTGDFTIANYTPLSDLSGICVLTISNDQNYLHVACRDEDNVKTYLLKPNGSLVLLNTFKQQENNVIGLDLPYFPRISWDNEYLYVPAANSNGFSNYKQITDLIFAHGFEGN